MATENLKEIIGALAVQVGKHKEREAKLDLFHGLKLVLRQEPGRVRLLAVRKAKPGRAHLVLMDGTINRSSYLKEGEIVKKAAESAGLTLTDHEELNAGGWTGHGWNVKFGRKNDSDSGSAGAV